MKKWIKIIKLQYKFFYERNYTFVFSTHFILDWVKSGNRIGKQNKFME